LVYFVNAGRREILWFFYFYAVTTIAELLVVPGIVPLYFAGYPYFVALYIALAITTFWILFFNGFVPFQFVDDGSKSSITMLMSSSLAVFVASFFVSIATFLNAAGLSSKAPLALWIVYIIFPAALVLLYIVSQVVLVLRSLDDRSALSKSY
jgi:hypothetical protein